MNAMGDSFTLGRAAGAIAVFLALYTALKAFLSNPTIGMIEPIVWAVVVAGAIVWAGKTWGLLPMGM